jgi:hypothetical protein
MKREGSKRVVINIPIDFKTAAPNVQRSFIRIVIKIFIKKVAQFFFHFLFLLINSLSLTWKKNLCIILTFYFSANKTPRDSRNFDDLADVSKLLLLSKLR